MYLKIMILTKKLFSFLSGLTKKNKERKEKIRSINKDFILIIFLISIPVIYYLFTKRKKTSLIILSFLLSTYSSYRTFFQRKEMVSYIDSKFQKELTIIEKKEKEKIIRNNKINRLIITDKLGKELSYIEISKDTYLIGKKNKKTLVDIDLINTKNSDTVSKVHAKIFCLENKWYVEDENSTNGTILLKTNNRKIFLKGNKEKIIVGDIVEISNDIKLLIN